MREALQVATEAALWAIFHRSSNPSVAELMNQGCRLMMHAPQLRAAKEMFDAITHLEPSFAEVRHPAGFCLLLPLASVSCLH